MKGRRVSAIVLGCVALLCALPWLAQPGSDLPQESQDALNAQREDVAPVKTEKQAPHEDR